MANWQHFAADAPELATFASERLTSAVAYLATIRRDGSPRVHPVSPILTPDGLYVFMEPDSPKRADLLRDPRYALHAGVEDREGGGGELTVSGVAVVETDALRRTAVASAHTPDRYVLFELTIARVVATTYAGGTRTLRRWPPPR